MPAILSVIQLKITDYHAYCSRDYGWISDPRSNCDKLGIMIVVVIVDRAAIIGEIIKKNYRSWRLWPKQIANSLDNYVTDCCGHNNYVQIADTILKHLIRDGHQF